MAERGHALERQVRLVGELNPSQLTQLQGNGFRSQQVLPGTTCASSKVLAAHTRMLSAAVAISHGRTSGQVVPAFASIQAELLARVARSIKQQPVQNFCGQSRGYLMQWHLRCCLPAGVRLLLSLPCLQ